MGKESGTGLDLVVLHCCTGLKGTRLKEPDLQIAFVQQIAEVPILCFKICGSDIYILQIHLDIIKGLLQAA